MIIVREIRDNDSNDKFWSFIHPSGKDSNDDVSGSQWIPITLDYFRPVDDDGFQLKPLRVSSEGKQTFVNGNLGEML